MSIAASISNQLAVNTPLASKINSGCKPVGGIFRLDYSSAIVLTDDFRKSEAGGVPQGCFLLAASGSQSIHGFSLDDQELILLRVRGTAPLPNEAELIQTRLSVVRDASNSGLGFDEVTDVLTRNELQQSAFDCEVIGTFYTAPEDAASICFGADIDNVVSSARYQVFLPSDPVLSWLASYSDNTDQDDLLNLGVVRYSSTLRRAKSSKMDRAEARIHVKDFVARKTAVFGMTRSGKSNTIKTLVTAVFRYSAVRKQPIGQLIFDPQGEYANVNVQDQTGLRLLGDESRVRIYRIGADQSDSQVFPLGTNFYDVRKLETTAEFVTSAIVENYGNLAYVKNFASISWDEPPTTEPSSYAAWNRARVGFYGLLATCNFSGSHFVDSDKRDESSTSIDFTWSRDEYLAFTEGEGNESLVTPPSNSKSNIYRLSSPSAANRVTQFMIASGKWDQSSDGKSDRPFKFIAGVFQYASAKAAIRTLTGFHTTMATERADELIWKDMVAGRLAIIDLSYGSDSVSRIISEDIVRHILQQASIRFRSNKSPVPIQIVVEEAHNLFDRAAKTTQDNPWIRLSKEAAKYHVGLIYSTQEVSSVDQRILSNTSNWLIAHLNSDKETGELSHYYDFKTWADSVRRSEDPGFIRMKTHSGKYIVPIQVTKFDHEMISNTVEALGSGDIESDGDGSNAIF